MKNMADAENQNLLDFLEKSNVASGGARFGGKSPVIKNKQTRQSEQEAVKILVRYSESEDRPQVEPILEKGLIVGLQFTCSCHQTTEVRFEYDDSLPARQGRKGPKQP